MLICEQIWQNQASTHIQFYNFEGPQLCVGKYHHIQILSSSFMKIYEKNVQNFFFFFFPGLDGLPCLPPPALGVKCWKNAQNF